MTNLFKILLTLLITILITSIGLYITINNFKFLYEETGGVNHYEGEVNLRKIPDMSASAVAYLDSEEFAPINKAAARWIYINHKNQELVVHKNVFALGYSRLFGKWVIKTQQLRQVEKQITSALLPGISLLVLSLLLIFIVYRNRQHKSQNWSDQVHQQYEVTHNGDTEIQSSVQTNPSNAHLADLKTPPEAVNVYDNPLVNINKSQKQKEIEEQFCRQAEAEINARFHHDMAAMRETIDRLQQKYTLAKETAAVFGIDLEDSNIGGLVKGRQFELFAATIWHEDHRTTIEDWTPDKGILDGIYIRSNSNPDFKILVMHNSIRKAMAVECKYRGRFYPNKKDGKPTYIDLDASDKIHRYEAYQEDNNIDVYLLLGVGGQAKNPESLYLLEVDDVKKIKHNYTYKNNNKIQYKTTKQKLDIYKTNKDELVDKLISNSTGFGR